MDRRLDIKIFWPFLILAFLFHPWNINAQDNVGIGISNPHPSAKLHLADTLGKGFLIPRTDTAAVLAYVNSLTPNPGIADGLLIFQKSNQVFYYYDGDQSKWVPLSGIVGPTGGIGPTGPTGPRGAQGFRGFVRDTNGALLPEDRFGNYFINMFTGEMTQVNRMSNAWTNLTPSSTANWRGKTQGGFIAHASTTGPVVDPFPAINTTFSPKLLPGLRINIPVGFDTSGVAIIRAYGSVKKVSINDDFNYAIYNLRLNGVDQNVPQIVGMGPNGTTTNEYPEQVSWQIAHGFVLNPGVNVIEVWGSQYQVDVRTGDILLCDGPGSNSQAHLDVYVIYTRKN